MDFGDLIYLILIRGPFVLPLVYVLTILLRVACHFAGVEIPALGRAFVTAGATSLPTMVAAMLVASRLPPIETTPNGLFSLFMTLAATLFMNLAVCTVVYRLLLPVRFRQAFAVWLIQAISFVAIAIACAGLIAVSVMLFFN